MAAVVLLAASAGAAADQVPLTVDESHLTDYWTRAKNAGQPPPLVPKAAMRVGASGCVAVAFTIDAEGKGAAPKILNSFIARHDADDLRHAFEASVMENVPYWRFVPAGKEAQPISTYVTVTVVAELGLHSKKFQEETAAHCKVDDFSPPSAPR
jgi:outer membrane biosynthesis protein TonB